MLIARNGKKVVALFYIGAETLRLGIDAEVNTTFEAVPG
jgi:hypothetical protein